MTPLPRPLSPQAAAPVLARMYGADPADFQPVGLQLTAAWELTDGDTLLGAVALRPSPAHGAEVMGGAVPGAQQHGAALALLRAALAAAPQLYAYAEAHLLPASALQAAGLREVGAYTRLGGPLPKDLPVVPAGFHIVPLAEVTSLDDRQSAQLTYAPRIGHTVMPLDASALLAPPPDDLFGWLAYDANHLPAGLCRNRLDGAQAYLDAPGVRADLQGSGLRTALLLSVCAALRPAGATHLTLEAWGDTEEEVRGDLALGLERLTRTPIYAARP